MCLVNTDKLLANRGAGPSCAALSENACFPLRLATCVPDTLDDADSKIMADEVEQVGAAASGCAAILSQRSTTDSFLPVVI